MKLAPKLSRLVQARIESGMTPKDLAKLVGASPSTISSIENGHHRPSKVLFKAICDALAVNPQWIEAGETPILLPKETQRQKFTDFMEANVAFVDAQGTITFKPREQKQNLPLMQLTASLDDVKPQLPLLRARLSKFASVRGKKTELAAFIERVSGKSAPLSSVSRWVSGEVEPGGEVTLLMQKWVEHQELQQK